MFNYEDYFKKEFGKRMLLARKKAGYTQTEVAKMMGEGWYQQNVKDIEKGNRVPQKANLLKFAEIYNVTEEYLMFGESDPYNLTETEYGFDFSMSHSNANNKTTNEAKENIQHKTNKLNKDNLSFISDVCDAVYYNQKQDELEKKIEQSEEQFKTELLNVKKKKK